jgi:hypothetical protein
MHQGRFAAPILPIFNHCGRLFPGLPHGFWLRYRIRQDVRLEEVGEAGVLGSGNSLTRNASGAVVRRSG